MARYAVVGATSWGLTLASLLERNGHEVTVVTRTAGEAQEVADRHGIERLPELRLSERIQVAAAPIREEIDGIIVAVPGTAVRESVLAATNRRDGLVLSAAKGIASEFPRAGEQRISAVLAELGWRPDAISVISGPNLAHEVVRGLPAAAVLASRSSTAAESWQKALSQRTFRVYTSADVVGVELAGALKNVIAIAAGAAWGLEFGANAVATILTRGLAEMSRLGVAAGGEPATFQGLAGVGDLSATCFSPLSRNRRFGELLGRGLNVEEARAQIGEVIEGIRTAPFARLLGSRFEVELPICEAVYRVVWEQATVPEAMAGLLARPLTSEAAWTS